MDKETFELGKLTLAGSLAFNFTWSETSPMAQRWHILSHELHEQCYRTPQGVRGGCCAANLRLVWN
jgi:hypothetical protein